MKKKRYVKDPGGYVGEMLQACGAIRPPKKNPKPKTQTLWAVVEDETGSIFNVYIYKKPAEWLHQSLVLKTSVRRLTVPAFAPKRRKAK